MRDRQSKVVGERLAQFLSRTIETALHRPGGGIDDLGDLVVGEAFVNGKNQDLSLVAREARDCGREGPEFFARFGVPEGVRGASKGGPGTRGSAALHRYDASAGIPRDDDAAQLQHSPRVHGNEGVADLFGGGWRRGFDRSLLAEPSFVRSVAHGKGRETGAKGENEDWFHRGMG